MFTDEKHDQPPSYHKYFDVKTSLAKCGGITIPYHLRINRYRGLRKDTSGTLVFSGFLDSKDDAVTIPPDATWASIRKCLWDHIINRYPAIVQRSTKEKFTLGFGFRYAFRDDAATQRVSGHRTNIPEAIEFLHCKDVVVVQIDVAFCPLVRTEARQKTVKPGVLKTLAKRVKRFPSLFFVGRKQQGICDS